MASSDLSLYTTTTSTITTSWGAFVPGGSWDVTVTASAGDIVEVGVSSLWSSAGVYCRGDVATIVSGSVVNWVSTGTGSHTTGVGAFFQVLTNTQMTMTGSMLYTVQSGDISGGTVTFRLYGQVTSSTRAFVPTASLPAQFWASVCDPASGYSALSGTLTTTWALLTGSVTIAATAGDVVAVGMSGILNPSTTVVGYFDAATVVSSAAVNWLSTGTSSQATEGISGWRCDMSDYDPAGGSVLYTVQSGDVVSGQVTFRIGAKTSSGTRALDSASAFFARRIG